MGEQGRYGGTLDTPLSLTWNGTTWVSERGPQSTTDVLPEALTTTLERYG
ncbi:hypothetical protein ACFWZ2_11540 [Streptomyces sp. NPDC059002]